MDLSNVKNLAGGGLLRSLGAELVSTAEPDTCGAVMPVDSRNCQPFGFLSGGASLALAESLAGAGSMALCPGRMCVGISVSGNHVRAVRVGSSVSATARLRYRGGTIHVWQVDISNSRGQLVSTVTVTNYVTGGKKQVNSDE